MAIGLGTATAAFIDIVGYLLRMNVYFEGLKRGLDIRLARNERFECFLNPTFKFVFLVSVKFQDEVIGYELCDKLTQFNRDHGLQNFEYRLRVSAATPQRWDAAYLKTVLNPKEVARVFIASRTGSEEPLTKLFADIGVPRGLVVLA